MDGWPSSARVSDGQVSPAALAERKSLTRKKAAGAEEEEEELDEIEFDILAANTLVRACACRRVCLLCRPSVRPSVCFSLWSPRPSVCSCLSSCALCNRVSVSVTIYAFVLEHHVTTRAPSSASSRDGFVQRAAGSGARTKDTLDTHYVAPAHLVLLNAAPTRAPARATQ